MNYRVRRIKLIISIIVCFDGRLLISVSLKIIVILA